ncbi:COX15/CtaA family protein [Allorhizobium sp. BGMRC 0089]|uniref:COX15/CtaA family protein n=1 Tax=Allorhizobium sonneratiae TaxID=2934936 RepID=UPI002034A3E0|nr:COX15/CtaA family protein [Allorhizobium sonneratiae]MCM2292145.1 COX15/CtaA family protein [Allorhizobium sonneratiae]
MTIATSSPAASTSASEQQEKNRRAIRIWLGIVVLAIFALVLVGGATRLTNSGLSITEWQPIHGVIPPLNLKEWQEEFSLYQKIPQYELMNKGMTLDQFKGIYWWEWSHRFLARSIGMIFALPLLFFWLTGRIEKQLRFRLLGILALGGLQGFIGWWMVSSGLTQRTEVSQYRLAIHLVMACLIYSASIWVMHGLMPARKSAAPARSAKGFAIALFALVLFQIYLGALVAGLRAGYAYNTWPLMDGAFIPGDLFIQHPWWINLFENVKTVQFVHRCGAYLLLTVAFLNMMMSLSSAPNARATRRSLILFLLICAQATLGILTLIWDVPFHVALTHQAGALIVLGFAVAHLRLLVGPYPPEPQEQSRS